MSLLATLIRWTQAYPRTTEDQKLFQRSPRWARWALTDSHPKPLLPALSAVLAMVASPSLGVAFIGIVPPRVEALNEKSIREFLLGKQSQIVQVTKRMDKNSSDGKCVH